MKTALEIKTVLNSILEAAKSDNRSYLAISLIVNGVTVKDICNLKRKDFDIRNRRLLVESSLFQRQVILSDDTAQALQSYFNSRRDKSPYAFVNKVTGQHITQGAIYGILKTVSLKARLRRTFNYFDIRKLVAINKIVQGVPYSQIAYDLGERIPLDWLNELYHQYGSDNVNYQKGLNLITPYKKGRRL